jgi:hypothetical protein
MRLNPMHWIQSKLFNWLLAGHHAGLMKRLHDAEQIASQANNARRDEEKQLREVLRVSVEFQKMARTAIVDASQLRLALQTDIREREEALGGAHKIADVADVYERLGGMARRIDAAALLASQAANSVSAMEGWLRKDTEQTRRLDVIERWIQFVDVSPIASDFPNLAKIREIVEAAARANAKPVEPAADPETKPEEPAHE